MNKKMRNPAADVIRCFACYLVVSVHFLLNGGAYSVDIHGKRMYVMVMIRCACMICVPLFLMLSGYLMNKVTLNRLYYIKRIKIIVIYILASIMCEIYNVIYLHQNRTLLDCIKGILAFKSAKYSWYVEMYIGLALLIPFLGMLWNALPDKKWKMVLVCSLILVTSLPSVVNVYKFRCLGWWQQPSINTEYVKLIPDKWSTIYPIMYFFIGCYLREYKLQIKKKISVLLIILIDIVFGTYTYWRSYNTKLVESPWNGYYSLFVVILAILVFDLLLKFDYSKMSDRIKGIFKFVSGLCLGIYLVSSIFDNMFYTILNNKISYVPHRLEYIFIMVPLVFICSMGLSFIINCIYNGLYKGCLKIKELK